MTKGAITKAREALELAKELHPKILDFGIALKALDDEVINAVPDGLQRSQRAISRMYFQPNEVKYIHIMQNSAKILTDALREGE